MKYIWGPYANFPVKAQVVGEHLENIREFNAGELTPAAIVDDAKRKNSPIHACFEWNNTKAAHQHRLYQARMMVQHVKVRIDSKPEAPTVRAFVRIEREEQNFFTSVEDALGDEEMYAQVLARAKKEALDFQRRYQDLEEFAAVFKAISEVAA